MSLLSPSLVLPEWQDDSDVTACPICKRNFHFLFRKHHCRRCGRIICDQCSPHRITLPRQYIVRPPWEAVRFRIDTGDDDEVYTSNPALGGGETVRVCNPCVPDPNYGPPPPQVLPDIDAEVSRAPGDATTTELAYNFHQDTDRAATFTSPRRSPERTYPDRYRNTRGGDQTSPTRRSRNATAYYSHGNRRTSSSAGVPAHQVLHARINSRSGRPDFAPPVPTSSRPIPPLPSGGAPSSMQPRTPSGSLPPAYTHIFATPGSQYPSSTSQFPGFDASAARPAFRQILQRSNALPTPPPQPPVREEDECPVCGTDAPPFGPNGDESAREVHIESCIENHLQFSSTPRSQSHLPPQPTAPSTSATQAPPADPASSSSPPATNPSTEASTSFNAARLPSIQPSSSPSTSSLPRASSSSTSTPHNSFPPPSTTTANIPLQRRTAGYQRMLLFHATEKDCQPDPETGDAPECVICFEEFEPGQEMGRLECLCKFHRACIRAWWESSPGSNLGMTAQPPSIGPQYQHQQQNQNHGHGHGQAGGAGGGGLQPQMQRGERWGTCPTHVLHH